MAKRGRREHAAERRVCSETRGERRSYVRALVRSGAITEKRHVSKLAARMFGVLGALALLLASRASFRVAADAHTSALLPRSTAAAPVALHSVPTQSTQAS